MTVETIETMTIHRPSGVEYTPPSLDGWARWGWRGVCPCGWRSRQIWRPEPTVEDSAGQVIGAGQERLAREEATAHAVAAVNAERTTTH